MRPSPRVRAAASAVLAAGFALAALPAWAQQGPRRTFVREEFWIDLAPAAKPGPSWPASAEEGATRLADEAAWLYAGMLWGFGFEYTPLDRTRAVGERFVARPQGSFPRGDPRIVPDAARVGEDSIRAFVEFRPSERDVAVMDGYDEAPWKTAQGIGKADHLRGWEGRLAAYEDGMREAVRSLSQSLVRNKPRLVRGEAVFDRVPSLAVKGGSYVAQVKVRVKILEVRPYEVF